MGWLSHWSFDAPVIVGGVVFLTIYSVGVGRNRETCPVPWWQLVATVSSVVALFVASCSSLDYYSASLFWVHMVQHLVLIAIVAPLFVLGAPWIPLAAAIGIGITPNWFRGLSVPWMTWPIFGFAAFVAGTWLWHMPVFYDAALNNEVIHDYLEHNTFLIVSVLFWLQVIPSAPFRAVSGYPMRIAFLLAAIVQNVALSIYLAFAPTPLYLPYAQLLSRPGGLSALTDQRLGAAIMWAAGDIPFVIAILVLAQIWLVREMAGPHPEAALVIVTDAPIAAVGP